MTRRADLLILGSAMILGGGALLAYLSAFGDLGVARRLGAVLFIAVGMLAVVAGSRENGHEKSTAEPRRWLGDRRIYGFLLMFGGIEVALWSQGMPEKAGQLGVATGFLLVGAAFVYFSGRER